MLRLILLSLLFLLSLLTVFRAPTNLLWYVAILVTEFCWIFFIIVGILLLLFFKGSQYNVACTVIGLSTLILFAVPVVQAYRIAPSVKGIFYDYKMHAANSNSSSSPFHIAQLITGIDAKQILYQTFTYDAKHSLTLDWYSSAQAGKRPCVVVVHGGSWAGGDSRQLPEINSELAKNGYNVATINYRLAPQYTFPAPVQDVAAALAYLRSHAQALFIDTTQFVLLGRSAGGQIVLSAAYTLHDPSLAGVISFYGPSDMVWGYANPTSMLVMDSRKIMEDYLGGTYPQVPQQYVNSSATETASVHAIPTLLIHGENDPLVSPLHGVRLGKKLDSLHVKHYDIYLPWATHAFDYTLNGPGGQISTWSVLQFLKIVTKQ